MNARLFRADDNWHEHPPSSPVQLYAAEFRRQIFLRQMQVRLQMRLRCASDKFSCLRQVLRDQWRSQNFVMGGFSAGTPGNWGRARGRVREGVYPLLPGVRGLGPRENFSDCRRIFVSFSALFRQCQNSEKPALCL
jgi:hypothetical protein